MRGSIETRIGKRGISYRLRVPSGKGTDGNYQYARKTVRGGSKRDAERELRALIAEVEAGGYVDTSVKTVAQLLAKWLESVTGSVRPGTAENYRMYVNSYIRPILGSLRVTEITPDQVQRMYIDLENSGGRAGRPLSKRTIQHVHRTLSQAFKYSVMSGITARNVCDRVTSPKSQRKEIRIFEPGEVSLILEHIHEHSKWAYLPTALALVTGMRRSEILALQWGDLDLDSAHPSVAVRRGFTRLLDGTEVINPPKSARGVRQIALSPKGIELLEERRVEFGREAQMLDRTPAKSNWVFASPLGDLYRPGSLSQAFRRACRATGIKRASFHGLRHTHATALLAANTHPKVVQERLGHSTISTTIDIYSHAVPGLQSRAAEVFDDAYGSALIGDRKQPVLDAAD